MYSCIRVYNNSDEVHKTYFSLEEMEAWLDYNRKWRFGCALFVDGVCKYQGYLCKERCDGLEEKFRRNTNERNMSCAGQ